MRKFHFAQPFTASYNASNTTAKSANILSSVDFNSLTPSEQTLTDLQTEQFTSGNTTPNNDYVSGVIDLDRALEEYYKSLIR